MCEITVTSTGVGSGGRSGNGSNRRQIPEERNVNVGVEREIGRISTIQISRAIPAKGNVRTSINLCFYFHLLTLSSMNMRNFKMSSAFATVVASLDSNN